MVDARTYTRGFQCERALKKWGEFWLNCYSDIGLATTPRPTRAAADQIAERMRDFGHHRAYRLHVILKEPSNAHPS